MFDAVFQQLTGTAVAGSPVALPAVVGQPGDPLLWSVMQGAAVINTDGTVTYPAAGTYVLQFQDAASYTDNYMWLISDDLPDQAACDLQNGDWWAEESSPGGFACFIQADFSGIVTVTVTAAPAPGGTSVDAGGTVATSPLLPLASLLVLAGLGMALRARRTA